MTSLGPPRVFAIVPAAGRSRRMGSPKQLLPIAGRPMLQVVVESLCGSAVNRIVVVTHSAIVRQLDLMRVQKTHVAINDDEHSEMIDSIRMGIAEVRRLTEVSDQDGLLILPGDQPGIAVEDFDRCIEAFRSDPAKVVIATFEGRHGHPVIFSAVLAGFVRSRNCDAGLNALTRAHGDLIVRIPCKSAAAIRDLDTPEEYSSS